LGLHSDLALHNREFLGPCRAYMGRFKADSPVWDQNFTIFCKEITWPLLLMCAPDDVLIEYLSRVKEIKPEADTLLLKGANFKPGQDPGGTVEVIRKFLSKHEG